MRIFQENTSETCKRLKKMAWSVKILTYEGPVFFSPSEICPNLLYFSCTYADDFLQHKLVKIRVVLIRIGFFFFYFFFLADGCSNAHSIGGWVSSLRPLQVFMSWSTAWMLGRTPPWVMLTPDRSWFNSSSFRMASWRWWGWFWSSCCHKQRYLPLSSWKKNYLIIHKSSKKKSQY